MTSNKTGHRQAFVWIWLPTETTPVVAGRLSTHGGNLTFNYGQSYLKRSNAIPIYDGELPLRPGALPLRPGLTMPSCIRDGAPDAWGRRVIINKMHALEGADGGDAELDELTYLLESGSDRIGALDFQLSATDYVPRSPVSASLDELLESAERVEHGVPLTRELDLALLHGSSIGGARPKVSVDDANKKYIAKFSSSTDLFAVVKAEFVAMRLALLAGLDVAPVSLAQASKRDVLLVERFDRRRVNGGWLRKNMVSALTLFGLDEMMARYASYEDLAEIIRHAFGDPSETLRELFSRLVFNILSGNTDDHARNHAAFCDGETLTLTPAYDICPQARAGNEASQAMLICGDNRMSRISSSLQAAHHFLLSENEARAIVEHQIATIGTNWSAVCDEAELSDMDWALLTTRQFLNPFGFEDLEGKAAGLAALAADVRAAGRR